MPVFATETYLERFLAILESSVEKTAAKSMDFWAGWTWISMDALAKLPAYFDLLTNFELQNTQWVGLSGHKGARTPSYESSRFM